MAKKNKSGEADSLTRYYRELEDVELLNKQEERELIIHYLETGCPKAKARIIEGALRFVISEARKHPLGKRNRATMQDLISAGNVGLCRALDKFNPEAGTRFLTYAAWWIKHEMREAGRSVGVYSIPAHAMNKGVRPPPTVELNDYQNDYGENDSNLTQVDNEQSIIALMDRANLSVREAFIVKACYGVHTHPKTLRAIGNILSITGERVRQMREAALTKLRASTT